MDAKFRFCITFYARIQSFKLLGPTKLFLWLFKITRFFKKYMDFPYEEKSGKNFPHVHFYMDKPYKNLRKRQFSDSCKNNLAGHIDPKFLHLGISFDGESEFGIHFFPGATVTTSLVLMSRIDVEKSA